MLAPPIELELLRTVSDQVAAAVDRGQLIARLEEQVRERRQAEAERDMLLSREREARADAERASSEKDEFLARLSHELRTPLSAMLGWIRMLRTGRLSPDKAERALESIERNARVQVQLIEDLLDVTRIVAGKVVLQRRAGGCRGAESEVAGLRVAAIGV